MMQENLNKQITREEYEEWATRKRSIMTADATSKGVLTDTIITTFEYISQ